MKIIGNPLARVIIAEWAPLPGEVEPFEAAQKRRCLREMLANQGVSRFVKLAYIRTDDTPPRRAADEFLAEVRKPQYKSVILLGLEAAQQVLRVSDQSIEDLRQIEFHWPGRLTCPIFVTYSSDVMGYDDANEKPHHPMQWVKMGHDLMSVFNVDSTYFTGSRELKG